MQSKQDTVLASAVDKADGSSPPDAKKAISCEYFVRGEKAAVRNIIPTGKLFWGTTDLHKSPRWLLEAWDVDKKASQVYVLDNINFRFDVYDLDA